MVLIDREYLSQGVLLRKGNSVGESMVSGRVACRTETVQRRRKRLALGSALAALSVAWMLMSAQPANATAITAASDITVTWSLPYSGAGAPTAAATAEMKNFDFSGNSVTFQMDVTNTSTGTAADANPDVRFTSFGWTTSPVSTGVSDSTNVYVSEIGGRIPSQGSVSVCFYAGPKCQGGSNGGLEDPNNTGRHGDPTTTGWFNVTLNFGTGVPPLEFSDFYGKFQAGGSYGSIEGAGTVTPVSPVPEPASMALLASGLLALGTLKLRRRA